MKPFLFSRYILFLTAFVSFYYSLAQEQNAVGLKNGEEITASEVRLKTPVFGRSYIEADGERYDFDAVKYYKNESGFFEKLTAPRSTKEEFFRREVHGPRIKAYSRVVTQMTYSGMAPTMQAQRLDYYVKGHGPMRMMVFSKLKEDLADHAGSRKMLRSVKPLRMVTGVLYLAGAGMIISGISSGLSDNNDRASGRDPGVPPLFIAGAVAIAIPWLVFHPIKRKKMMQAVMVYNQ